MIIGISGAVSTGKTTLALLYSEKKGIRYISLKDIAEKNALLKEYDSERDAYVVDVNELEKAFEEEVSHIEGDIIVESHFLVEQRFTLDLLILLRVSPIVLFKRMIERGYSEKKAYENALAEATDYFSINALKHYPSKIVYELNLTGKNEEESLNLIEKVVKGEAKREYFSFPVELKEIALMDKY